MFKVGDYVTGMSYLGGPIAGRVTAVSPVSVMVDDGTGERYCLLGDVHKADPPIPNEDIMLDEFDEGGLKKMPDGALESVHIPTEKEAMIPYTATGTGGPPKPKPFDPYFVVKYAHREGKRWCIVRLHYAEEKWESTEWVVPPTDSMTPRGFRKLEKKIAKIKQNLASLVSLLESGRVE